MNLLLGNIQGLQSVKFAQNLKVGYKAFRVLSPVICTGDLINNDSTFILKNHRNFTLNDSWKNQLNCLYRRHFLYSSRAKNRKNPEQVAVQLQMVYEVKFRPRYHESDATPVREFAWLRRSILVNRD